MAEQLQKPTKFEKYTDLSDQSQVNPDNYIYQLPRLINNLSRMIGDNVVLKGLDVDTNISNNGSANEIEFSISLGTLIQNHVLIEIKSGTTITLPDSSVYDTDGKLAVYVQYQYLDTIQDNPVRFGVQYIAQTGDAFDGWDHNKNGTVLTYYDFTKDVEGNIASITESNDEFIEINTSAGKKAYYKYGLSGESISLIRYINYFLDHLDIPTSGGDGGTTPPQVNPTIISDDLVVQDSLEVGGDLNVRGNNTFIAHDLDVVEDLTVQGIFKSQGERFLIQSDDVEIDDREIMLNANEIASGITGRFAGLRVNRGSLPPALLIFDEEDDIWRIGIEGQELTTLNWGDTKPQIYKYSSAMPSVQHLIRHNLDSMDLTINVLVEDAYTGLWSRHMVGIEMLDTNQFNVDLTESSNIRVSVQEIR